ncbi:response regulator [Halorarius halobius]|uniref:response regulator n=1 Tax=Halorarius halobius TaxID=2962671 RepID=UPI0020CEF522|nr:response regulator [Halorarius halobius]
MIPDSPITTVHLDDDADLLTLSREFVEQAHETITVEGYTEPDAALARVEEGGVDCVVTDYKMATMDGLTVLRRVRELDEDLPVVFFTGKGSEEIASEAISAGVTDYLRKTTGTEQYRLLGTRIATLVERRRAQERAAEADRRIREIYERITVAFVAFDEAFRFTYVNEHAERLLGRPAMELEGAVLWEKFPSAEGTAAADALRTALSDQRETHVTDELDIGDEHVHVELHAYPSEDGVSVFVEDRTEAVHREAELESLRADLEMTEQQFRTLHQKLSRPASPFR